MCLPSCLMPFVPRKICLSFQLYCQIFQCLSSLRSTNHLTIFGVYLAHLEHVPKYRSLPRIAYVTVRNADNLAHQWLA
jgi:hypothetical protein